MKKFGKAGYVFVRVFEILHWAAAVFCVFLCVAMAVAPDWLLGLYGVPEAVEGETLYTSMTSLNYLGNFSVVAVGVDDFNVGFQIMMMAASVVTAVLSALVFRKIGQVIKMSRESTPFQKPVVDRVRQVGWLFIAIPLVTVAVTLLADVIFWPSYSFTVDVSDIVTGVIILGLTQIFAYGVKLEDDMEGLL